MYPITNAVKALFDAEQKQVLRITGTDKNNVSISITDENVMENGFGIDRYSCNGEKLEVGTAIASQMTLKLNNVSGTYDSIVFEGAELKAEVGIADWSQTTPTITYIPCGYFTPDEQPRRLNQISLTCLDRMTKFDVVVNAAALTLPATVANLVGQVCSICGVTLAQSISGLTNASVSITALPSVQGDMTYRNIIQWCAGIMATNAWIDWDGNLQFSWYNNSTNYGMTTANRFSSDLYEDDLTVTGAVYTNNSGVEIVSGTDDYAIDLTGNALAGPLVATVLPAINTAVNGFVYRPFTATVINAPYLWPMDTVTFTDKDGNDHSSVLTNVAFGVNGATALESKGMTYVMNARKQPKGITKEQAQIISEAMESVEADIDESLTQQDIFNRLTDNGAAQGMVLVNGQLYINATYMRSGTIDGGVVNAKLLNIVDANGNVIARFNNVITLGQPTDAHAELDFNSFEIKDYNGNVFFIAGDMRDATGHVTVVDTFTGDGSSAFRLSNSTSAQDVTSVTVDGVATSAWTIDGDIIRFTTAPAEGAEIVVTYVIDDAVYRYDLGTRRSGSNVGLFSVASGHNVTASGPCSHAEGDGTTASGFRAHAEGDSTTASGGFGSHAEGDSTTASGQASHAEGIDTTASGHQSHAEGYNTTASGGKAHAEGNNTTASGASAHAEGINTTASGDFSHAEGNGTIAAYADQHVFGKYNAQLPNVVEIVGNGSDDSNRSNARTLDWSGNEYIAGALSVGDAATTRANLGAVATSDIIDITHGGTGQSTQDGMRNAVFYNTSTTGITSYPTTAGLFRLTGTLPTGMPSGANAYGVLTIVGAGTYYTHRYVDAAHNVYYAYSNAAGAPSTWRKLTSATVNPVT